MEKSKGVLTGKIYLSSVQEKNMWFSLNENEEAANSFSGKESGAIARHILNNAEKWLAENHEGIG